MNKLSVAAMFLAFQGAAAYTISGRVVGVADGDTPNVLDEKTRTATKLEKSQPFGQRSKQSLSDLAYGRSVSIEWRKRDRYRRIVGKVFKGGRDVNLEQVRRGLAWHYKQYQSEQDTPDRARYADAKTDARAARREHAMKADQMRPRTGNQRGRVGCINSSRLAGRQDGKMWTSRP